MVDVVPSEELRALAHRLNDRFRAGDYAAVSEMFSRGPHVRILGPDPNENWPGLDGVEILISQGKELGGYDYQLLNCAAYRAGNVGWVVEEAQVTFGNGFEQHGRQTIVFVMEEGHWRIAHFHLAFVQPNEQSVGRALPTSIDKIERIVRNSRPDVARASAPEGTVTIAFSDIESSTVLLERLGDTEYLRMLAWHDRIVRDTADQHRGFVVKSQGDGFMLAFPSAAFALRASLVMRERIDEGFEGLPVRIRAGLHSGEAINHDDDFYGRTVVIAARISSLALGGEILISGLVHALAQGLGTFKFGSPRQATLKGLEGEFALYPVIG